MPAAFDNVLLTRFSAVLAAGGEPAREEWLRYRLGFFYDATYPSVISQSVDDFTWLVLFDDRCSDGFREDIESLAEDVFIPVWSHELFRRDSFAEPVAAIADAPFLITTRIDSDDAMAVDFMATVRAQFARQDRLFVSLTRGVQIDRSGAVYLSDQLSNPFLSLIERRDPVRLPDTVYVAKHARARAHGPVREVRAPVMWAQVVHDLNLSNIVNGPRVDPGVVAERLRFDLGYDADIAGRDLLAARARQAGRLMRLWTAHPGELTKAAEAWSWRLRGTHERPQDDGATLTDRVQRWEQVSRAQWESSKAHRRVLRLEHDARRAKWRVQRRLNESLPPEPHLVAGDLDAVLGADRIALLAEYSPGGRLRPEALSGAAAWAAAGVPTLVVAARDAWSSKTLQVDPLPDGVAVVRRPNVGYDFGSWGAALATYPEIAGKPLVVLTNDSLAGPFGPLDDVLARIETSGADVWAATDNHVPQTHLQSYLLAFRGGVLAREPLRGFLAGVRAQETKKAVVLAYEFGLTDLALAHGLVTDVGWSKEALGIPVTHDSALGAWDRMLGCGFPFVKRVLLDDRRFAHQRDTIALVIRQEFGVEIG